MSRREAILQAVFCDDFEGHATFFFFTYLFAFYWNDLHRTQTGRANVAKLRSYQGGEGYYSDSDNNHRLPPANCRPPNTKKSENRLQQMSTAPRRKRLQYPRDTSNSKIAPSPTILQRLKILN